jgi:type II secretory pathway pseudopilin PulG
MKAPPSSHHSFTLIEMLVAVSIMSFMLLMMAQMTGMAEQAWRMEQNRIDNFAKARSMVDMFNDDLQRAVFRGDLPIFGTGAPAATPTVTSNGLYYFTNTVFTTAFYTRLPGVPASASTPVRDVSLVSYAINYNSANQGVDQIVLQRSDLAVPWSSSQNLLFQGNIQTVLQNSPATAREVAPGVVGFRVAFRLSDGTMIDPTQGTYTGYNSTNPVVAVDIGVAVVGKQSLALLSPLQIQNLQKAFAAPLSFTAPAPVTNGIKASWDQKVLTAGFYSGSGYPKDLGGGLKTFERWVACPAF